MVKRKVINVVSKGTLVDLDFLDSFDFNYVASILDLKYLYVLTYADISTGDIYSEFISYNNEDLLNKLLKLNIKELIIRNDFNNEIINICKNNYGININYSNELYNQKLDLLNDLTDERVIAGVNHLFYYLIVK